MLVTSKDPYVMLIDADGKVLWRGYGPAAELESQLRAAPRSTAELLESKQGTAMRRQFDVESF